LTELSTGTFTSTGIDDNATSTAITIDANENVLVGGTDVFAGITGSTTQGISLSPQYNAIYASRSGGEPLTLNRQSSDGIIAQFRKDGAPVGSIGTNGNHTYFVGNDSVNGSGCGLLFGINTATPVNRVGTPYDGLMNLGSSSQRFKDLYLSGEAKASKVTLDDSNGGDLIIKKNGTSSAFIGEQSAGLGSGDGLLIYTYNSGTIRFYPEAGSVATMDSDGLKMETGKGVYLGGTGAANKLDDYEEGTFDLGIVAGASSATISTRDGYYVKIGSAVHIRAYVRFSSITTDGNNVRLQAPFPMSNQTSSWMTVGRVEGSAFSVTKSYNTSMQVNTNNIYVTAFDGTGPASFLSGSNKTLELFMTYHTDL
jgi:hypothetical protein